MQNTNSNTDKWKQNDIFTSIILNNLPCIEDLLTKTYEASLEGSFFILESSIELLLKIS